MQFHIHYSRYVAESLSGVLLLLTLLLSSCSVDGSHFKIEGHLLNINQSEFYVYAENGSVDGLDTIHVEGGRFAYEVPCKHPTILYLVFPNYDFVCIPITYPLYNLLPYLFELQALRLFHINFLHYYNFHLYFFDFLN